MESIERSGGTFANTEEETVRLLLRINFQGSVELSEGRWLPYGCTITADPPARAASTMVRPDAVVWALKSFAPY